MLAALKQLFSPPAFQHEAHLAYVQLVAQSRLPFFYEECAVPDTLDGRFDVIVLHLFLATQRLRMEESADAQEFARALQEVFFSDMDRSIREMGVSDTGVGKRIKKMAQACYGRLQAYGQSMGDEAAFKESLARNLYRGEAPRAQALDAVWGYAQKIAARLQQQPVQNILSGKIEF